MPPPFHPMNAYDDGNRIVLDVVRHPRMFDRDRLGPNEGAPTLDRWIVDAKGGKVIEQRLDDRGQEFPRVDERLVSRRHRYGYAAQDFAGAPVASVIFPCECPSDSTATGSETGNSSGSLTD